MQHRRHKFAHTFAGVIFIILTSLLPFAVELLTTEARAQSVSLPPLAPVEQRNLLTAGEIGNYSISVFSTLVVVPADGETEAKLTVKLTNADGVPIRGKTLSLSLKEGTGFLIPLTPNTDENGEAEFTYRAGRVAITNTITVLDFESGATFDFILPTSLSAVLTVKLVDPAEFQRERSASLARPDIFDLEVTAFPDVLVADGASISRITAQLRFKDGRPAPGFPINFRIVSGYGTIIQDKILTDGGGYIDAIYQAGLKVGVVLIEAVEQTTGKRATVEISVVEAGPARLKLFFEDSAFSTSETSGIVPADGSTRVEIVAQVLSLADTPISGIKVVLELKNLLGRLEITNDLTDANGKIHAFFVPGTLEGTEEISAFIVSAIPED